MPMEHVPSHAWTHFNAGKYFSNWSLFLKIALSAGTIWGLETGHSQHPDIGSGSEGEAEYCKGNVDLFPENLWSLFRVSTNWCREWRLIWLWETRTTSRRICPSSERWEDWSLFWKKSKTQTFRMRMRFAKGMTFFWRSRAGRTKWARICLRFF